MVHVKLSITRGDGPYRLAIPLSFSVNGQTVDTAGQWQASDGLGYSIRSQVRDRPGDNSAVLVEVTDCTIADIEGHMHLVWTLWPEDTTKLPIRGLPVSDIELRRSGDRVDTIATIEFEITGDVTR